jgi:CBS-domain-containing membrane protein
MANQVHGVRDDDEVAAAEGLMRSVQVRRVPVLDKEGRLKGILSLNDLARHRSTGPKANGLSGESIAQTLAAICEPHARAGASEPSVQAKHTLATQ